MKKTCYLGGLNTASQVVDFPGSVDENGALRRVDFSFLTYCSYIEIVIDQVSYTIYNADHVVS